MKKLSSTVLLLIWILGMLLPMACGAEVSDQMPVMGSSNDNIANLGYSVLADDWIYFRNDADHGSLHRIRTDGSETIKLNDDRPIFLNAMDGWIYYMDEGEPGEEKIYRIRPDGSERALITEIPGYYMRIADDWIYFINITGQEEDPETNKLFRMKLDGSEKQQITNRAIWFFSVAGEMIFYLDTSDGVIRRILTDGTGDETVSDQRVRRFAVNDQHIYYLDGPDFKAGIWRMKLDGTEPDKLSEDFTQGLNVQDGWIYYAQTDPADAASRRLKRIKVDGSEPQGLTDDEHVLEIALVGDWIYYAGPDAQGYRKATLIRIDGTVRKDFFAK